MALYYVTPTIQSFVYSLQFSSFYCCFAVIPSFELDNRHYFASLVLRQSSPGIWIGVSRWKTKMPMTERHRSQLLSTSTKLTLLVFFFVESVSRIESCLSIYNLFYIRLMSRSFDTEVLFSRRDVHAFSTRAKLKNRVSGVLVACLRLKLRERRKVNFLHFLSFSARWKL